MPVQSYTFQLKTRGFSDVHDVTPRVNEFVAASTLRDGIVTIFVPGSTAGVTTIEYESGAVADLKRAIERMAPEGIYYDHDSRWGDGNGFSHVRAALLGPSVTIPLKNGELQLGTWQQIVVVEFDNRHRSRQIIIQVVGE